MPVDEQGRFRVEDFIDAITSQLDRVQDSLRVKSVNRPLTYALKDFAMDLNIFVEMDEQGQVRFRPASPNETGASVVHLEFTTITRPMIEENTIELAVAQSPSLSELGLGVQEQKQLSRYGIRNAAELQKIREATGTSAISRLSGISVERLRNALSSSRPQVVDVKTVRQRTRTKTGGSGHVIKTAPPPRPKKPVFRPPSRVIKPGSGLVVRPADPRSRRRRKGSVAKPGQGSAGRKRVPEERVVHVTPEIRRLHVTGKNLIGHEGAPQIRLNNQILDITEAEDDRIAFDLPEEVQSGALEIELPDGEVITYELTVAHEDNLDDAMYRGEPVHVDDPWVPIYEESHV